MALPVALPVQHTCGAPHFDPAYPLTIQDYLFDYELLEEVAQLNPVDQLAKCTHYLERDIKMDWETLPEFKATPPDWKAFKAALVRYYPDTQDPEHSLAKLDKFIENIPTRNFHSSWSLQHSTNSSDGLPINYWPPTVFLNLKSRRSIPRASTWSLAG